MHVSFVCMIKFRLLAQFPLNYFPYPVVHAFELFLSQLATYAYYIIYCFISLS